MKPNHKRYIFATLELIFCIFIPAFVVGSKYDLYTRVRYFTRLQITLTGFIVLMIVLLSLRKRIVKWMSTWPTSVGKSIVDLFINYLPLVAMTGILLTAQYKIVEFVEIWWIIMGSYFIGLLFKQGHDYWIEYVIETRRADKWAKKEEV